VLGEGVPGSLTGKSFLSCEEVVDLTGKKSSKGRKEKKKGRPGFTVRKN